MIYFLPVCSFLYYKARIIKSQFYKFRLTVFKDSIICKTAVGKNICRFIKCIGDLVRTMCIGTPNILTDGQMAEALERFKTYGQPKKQDAKNTN